MPKTIIPKKDFNVTFDLVLFDNITNAAKDNFQTRTEFIRRACIEKLTSMTNDNTVGRSSMEKNY